MILKNKEKDLENDIIIEKYYEVVLNEYNKYFEKRNSFDSRSSFLATILVVIVTFFYNNEKLVKILKSINNCISIYSSFRFIISILIILFYIIAIYHLIKTISVKQGHRFKTSDIDKEWYYKDKNKGLEEIIEVYKNCNLKNNEILNDVAMHFQKSLYYTFNVLILIVIFMFI